MILVFNEIHLQDFALIRFVNLYSIFYQSLFFVDVETVAFNHRTLEGRTDNVFCKLEVFIFLK